MGNTRLSSYPKQSMRGKRYILKCLKKDFLYTPIYQQALTKEFEIGLQLEHPNICRTIGLEQLPELGTTIVMEYIDGDTLKHILDKKTLTKELAHKIASQLMDALAYMHSKQIIHRDLKPSNIMVTHTGQQVKLIDFGLSDSDAFYILKRPAGTTGYIAPEQMQKDAIAEPKTDIYSLGMVIRDMAKATGDNKLKKMAEACTIPNPLLRPDSIDKLRNMTFDDLPHRAIAIALCIISLILLVAIGLSYLILHQGSIEDCQQEETTENDSIGQYGNRVMDYHLWNK